MYKAIYPPHQTFEVFVSSVSSKSIVWSRKVKGTDNVDEPNVNYENTLSVKERLKVLISTYEQSLTELKNQYKKLIRSNKTADTIVKESLVLSTEIETLTMVCENLTLILAE